MTRAAISLGALLSLGVLGADCRSGSKKAPPPDEAPPVVTEAPTQVPQAMPVGDFDASLEPLEGKTPMEQAKIYESRGQLWMAQMSIEKQALGPDGTKAELEYLGWLCHQRDEEECLEKVEGKLGKRLRFDGGAPRVAIERKPHSEPASDVAKARDLVLKKDWDTARALLEPRVLAGKPAKEEIRLLKQVCQHQGDRMCVALCDSKLKK